MHVSISNSGYNVGEAKEYSSVNNYVFRSFCDMAAFYGRKATMGTSKLLTFSGLSNSLHLLMTEIATTRMSGESQVLEMSVDESMQEGRSS